MSLGRSNTLRRVRGGILRLARSRPAALVAGLLCVIPVVVVSRADYVWESWITDGLSLVGLGTGAALIVTAFAGRRPDWVEPD